MYKYILENGNSVYYKRENEKIWRGPGTVIGRDGKQVLVKHGSIYVRVHECRLQHAKFEINSDKSCEGKVNDESASEGNLNNN